MIDATSLSSRVQSAASWSKRPPSSCCRWRSPDASLLRKPAWLPIPPSRRRAMPGMAPVKIPIARALPHNRRGLLPAPSAAGRRLSFSPIQRNGGRRRKAPRPNRTPESTAPWSFAGDACASSLKPKIQGWPERLIEGECTGPPGELAGLAKSTISAAGDHDIPNVLATCGRVRAHVISGGREPKSQRAHLRISPLRQSPSVSTWQGWSQPPRSGELASGRISHGGIGTRQQGQEPFRA